MELEKTYIYQVYLKGSFSKAAEALFITQPALSIAIRKVEKEIGAAIFNRGQRPLTLTHVGKIYISHIKRELLLEQELKQQLDDLHGLKTGELFIGGTNYMNAYLLPPYISRFTEKYPNISINMSETSSDQLIDLLKENKLDFTFSCDEEVIGSFESFPSFSDTLLLAVPETFFLPQRLLDLALTASDVASGRHRAKDILAVNFKEFPAFNFILIDAHVNLGARTLKIFEEAGASPRVRIKVPQLVTAFSLAASGVGAAFISDRLVTGREKGLRFFKLQSPYAQRHYFLLLPHRSYTPSAVKEFIRLMEP